MEYVGIQAQRSKNNFYSMLLLFMFPLLVLGLTYLTCLIISFLDSEVEVSDLWSATNYNYRQLTPFVLFGTFVWFIIAYFFNAYIIKVSTGAKTLERKSNKRVYNLVENLCMSQGMRMPKIDIIDDESLNAFASGINQQTYTVTLSKGIIEKLNDEELQAVIAHELAHIRNHDVRLLIISIVFVGIFSMLAQAMFSAALDRSGSDKGSRGAVALALIMIAIIAWIGSIFAMMMRFTISRKREYLADACSAEMTKNPLALASALRKISKDPNIEAVTREDVAQLFIQHPGDQAQGCISGLLGMSGLFQTHPPIEERIRILEQF